MKVALLVAGVVLFVLAALGVHVWHASELDIIAAGLAVVTLAKVVP